MPVRLDSEHSKDSQNSITIGLLNNMGDEALEATERQYTSLLNSASGDIPILLSFYTLPNIPRSESNVRRISWLYSSIEDLWDNRLDGLIVTGREPLTDNLKEESYWTGFAKAVEWARFNTYSTVWSCLAAHAAVLHMDGIERARRNEKLFGISDCRQAVNHTLMTGIPSCFKLPHSRWNGLPEQQLEQCGYSVLTRTAGAEVDTFVKQHNSLFLFFQGHPEYESDTLLREYRRDVWRYFKHETSKFPLMPRDYFDSPSDEALQVLQLRTMTGDRQELLPEISTILTTAIIHNSWRTTATSIYKNWLLYITAQKEMERQATAATGITESPLAAV
jgi:homoserine O-succinyltransferase